jgi:prepilin-type N-terminal cleavage/methylation domain-containing protein
MRWSGLEYAARPDPLSLSRGGDTVARDKRGIWSRGFTLIELMIVVAIIAIPAYRDYANRAKMSEVLIALDAIAQGASEYHAAIGHYPDESYTTYNLADFSEQYATITLANLTPDVNMAIVATFKSSLDLTAYTPDYGQLTMIVSYDTVTGYGKAWDLRAANTTIDAVYLPRGR